MALSSLAVVSNSLLLRTLDLHTGAAGGAGARTWARGGFGAAGGERPPGRCCTASRCCHGSVEVAWALWLSLCVLGERKAPFAAKKLRSILV